jgi:hypothetical protein
VALKSFDECLEIDSMGVPKKLLNNQDYMTLLKVIASTLEGNYENLHRLDMAYNTSFVDIRDLPKLADTKGIVYPTGADADILRLLLKYYGKILKSRGTFDSIKQMIRLLEFSESDIYNYTLDDYSAVQIKLVDTGFILVKYDGITDFDYAYTMLRKVVPAGFRFEVSNLNGPVVKEYDKILIDFEGMINLECEILVSDTITSTESLLDKYPNLSDSFVGSDSATVEEVIEEVEP